VSTHARLSVLWLENIVLQYRSTSARTSGWTSGAHGCSSFPRPYFACPRGSPRRPDVIWQCLSFARPPGGAVLLGRRPRRAPARDGLRLLPLSHAHHMCSIWYTFETFRCNSCNIRKKTEETHVTWVWNICKNTWEHFKTIANIRNIQIKHLQYTPSMFLKKVILGCLKSNILNFDYK
jgi:hypothetical protein